MIPITQRSLTITMKTCREFPHSGSGGISKKKKKLADKILPQKVRDLVPESQAYMDLLAFERKLDSTIMRKRLDIQVRLRRISENHSKRLYWQTNTTVQEALKRPMKQKRKLRIFISNTFYPAKEPGEGGGQEEGSVASWELRVEGRLLEETVKSDPSKVRTFRLSRWLGSKTPVSFFWTCFKIRRNGNSPRFSNR